jgi:hypothetical protein
MPRLLKIEDLTNFGGRGRPIHTQDNTTGFRLAAETTRIRLIHTYDP